MYRRGKITPRVLFRCAKKHIVFQKEKRKKKRTEKVKTKRKKKKRKIYRRAYRGDEVGFDTARRHRLEKPVAFPTWNLILVIHFPFHRRAPLMNMTAG